MTEHNNFANTHVNSGKNGRNPNYITSQKNIINTLNKKEYDLNTPFPNKPSAFNPIVGHNQSNGTIKIRNKKEKDEKDEKEPEKDKEFDPYLDFLHKRGLLDGNTKTRY